MHPRTRSVGGLALASALVLAAAAGCGSAEDTAGSTGVVQVVASTNVYGDLAATIGGDRVHVTSVIDGPAADPHSFEAGVRTQLAVSRADLVIENGGGYDDFMGTLLSAAGGSPTVLTAVDAAGLDQHAPGFNEHVWYDLPAMTELTRQVAAALGDIDPEGSAGYTSHADELTRQLAALADRERAARTATEGVGVAVTEPVPGYLLDALGADDLTPPAFAEAVEEGNDVAPAVLRETQDLLAGGRVRALVYNEQTSGAETQQVVDAARAAGIAVVPVTETLPPGTSYLSWMGSTVDAVVAALTA